MSEISNETLLLVIAALLFVQAILHVVDISLKRKLARLDREIRELQGRAIPRKPTPPPPPPKK